MKVKIGNVIYDSEVELIMLILSTEDKDNIANMDNHAHKFCTCPTDMDREYVLDWMEDVDEQ